MRKLILASGSNIRKTLLKNAGLEFSVARPLVDEDEIIRSLLTEGAKPREICDVLAEYKAKKIANKYPAAYVLGCDQVLVCDDRFYQKSDTIDEAFEVLKSLRAKTHQLLSGVVIYHDNEPIWRHIGVAKLTMRDFSDSYLKSYIEQNQNKILSSVGCYQLEGPGVQLFSKIEGDYFTILGLPLIQVLSYLRTCGVIDQ